MLLSARRYLSSTGCTLLMAVASFVVVMVVLWLNGGGDPQPAQLSTAPPVLDAQFYRVIPDQSQLRVTVDSQLGEIGGGYAMGPGTVELSREPEGWRVIANLTFDARTLDIGNDQLNSVMRRALEVETYPNGIFIAQSRTLIPDLEAVHTVDLVGQLELHGVVQDYTIPTTVAPDGEMVTLTAQLVIDAGDFDVSIPALIADDQLQADLRVVAQRGSPDHSPGKVSPDASTPEN